MRESIKLLDSSQDAYSQAAKYYELAEKWKKTAEEKEKKALIVIYDEMPDKYMKDLMQIIEESGQTFDIKLITEIYENHKSVNMTGVQCRSLIELDQKYGNNIDCNKKFIDRIYNLIGGDKL